MHGTVSVAVQMDLLRSICLAAPQQVALPRDTSLASSVMSFLLEACATLSGEPDPRMHMLSSYS